MAVKTPMPTSARVGKLTGLGSLGALCRSLLAIPLLTLGVSLLVFVFGSESASATPLAPAWTLTSQFNDLAPGDSSGRGSYFITATNTGAAPTDGSPITLTDNLPSGLTAYPVGPNGAEEGIPVTCSPPATCTFNGPVAPGRTIYMWVPVDVAATPPPSVTNQVSISGGGVATVSATSQTPISATPTGFGIQSFDGATTGPDGSALTPVSYTHLRAHETRHDL